MNADEITQRLGDDNSIYYKLTVFPIPTLLLISTFIEL